MSTKKTKTESFDLKRVFSPITMRAINENPDAGMTRGLILSESNLWVPPNYHGTAAIADWLKAQLAIRPVPATEPGMAYPVQDVVFHPAGAAPTTLCAVTCHRRLEVQGTMGVEQGARADFSMSDNNIRNTFADCETWDAVRDLLQETIQDWADDMEYDDTEEDRMCLDDETTVDTTYSDDNPNYSIRRAMENLKVKIRELLPQTYARCEGTEAPF